MPSPTIVETAVAALLKSVAGIGAVYALLAPQNVRPPLNIYQRIDGERFASLTGPSGLAQVRIQVDSYADTYESAKLNSELIRQKLDGYSGTIGGVRIGGVSKLVDLPDQVDADSQTEAGAKPFRASKDYLFTYEEH